MAGKCGQAFPPRSGRHRRALTSSPISTTHVAANILKSPTCCTRRRRWPRPMRGWRRCAMPPESCPYCKGSDIRRGEVITGACYGPNRIPPAGPRPRFIIAAMSKPETTPSIVTAERCRILTAILLRHPKIVPSVADAYQRLALPPTFDEIRQAITRRSGKGRLIYKVREDVGQLVDQVLSRSPIPLPAIASRKRAETVWWLMFGLVPRRPRFQSGWCWSCVCAAHRSPGIAPR